jgi:hypothetical protein
MPRFKKTLVFFGIVDAVIFLTLSPNLLLRIRVLNPAYGTDIIVSSALSLLVSLSLVFSCYGFIRRRRWAMVLYYVQFPFRIWCQQLSWCVAYAMAWLLFGTRDSTLIFGVFGIGVVLEIARLVATICIHRSLVRRSSDPSVAAATSR